MTNENAVKGMSIKKKALIVLCALVSVVVIVATSVLATVALLTSSATVANTFTIGNVGIKMLESKVTLEGELFDEGKTKVDANVYKLVPNKTYIKDPVITVDAESEKSYLFITVRNDIAAIAADDAANGKPSIAYQLKQNGWAEYGEVATGKIYVYTGVASKNDVAPGAMLDNGKFDHDKEAALVVPGSYPVFQTFSIAEDADVSKYGAAKININAFAIQKAGMSNVDNAWEKVLEIYTYIHSGTSTPATPPTSGGTTEGDESQGEGA